MKSIFEYKNYRVFLKEHYQNRKGQNKSYSFRFFARKAQLDSPNYYKLVMDGERNLTHRTLRKFVKGLSLTGSEAAYFENLVFHNQAKDSEEKKFFEKNMKLARAQSDAQLLTRDQYNALSKWYPMVIRELALLENFYAKPKWIAARLDFRITPVEAREAVELLARLGIIKVQAKTKKITVTSASLKTPDLTHSDAVVRYHEQMTDLAKEALSGQTAKERCFSALTVAVNREDLPEAFRRIHKFRVDLDTLFGRNKKLDAVYQMNIHLFRLDEDV